MRVSLFGVTGLLMLQASSALAQSATETCESTFAKNGNPISGLRFTATHSVADVSVPNAINQLRGVALKRGYDVLASEPDAGSMLLENPQTANRRSFQLVAQATAAGQVTTVQLRANMRGGVFAKQEEVRTEMCGALAEIQGGRAGVTAATQGSTATAAGGAPTRMSAQILADRVSKERDQDVNEIPLRYQGRSFTLDGRIESVDRSGDSYRVVYEILSWEQKAVRLPGDSQFKTAIVCVLAPGQSVYALTLQKGKSVRLTGTYSNYRESPSAMWLSGCRPEP
jgi:hypothetical protein